MGRTELTARPLEHNELAAYDALAQQRGTVFNTLGWTKLFEPGLRRLGLYDRGGDLRGGFCVLEERRFGLKILRNPPFTREIGPFFESRAQNAAARTNEERAVAKAMATFFNESGAAVVSVGLSLKFRDALPFYWGGFKVIPKYTYRIELQGDDLLGAMSVDRRKNIRKARKDGVSVTELTGGDELRSLALGTFARQRKSINHRALSHVLRQFPPGQQSFGYLAHYKGKAVAGVYVVHDADTAYYLIGGYRDDGHHGAGALAMYHAIVRAQEMGLAVFDFEGSVVPAIERYFRGFGGRLTPVLSVHKAWLPLEMALKIVRRETF